MPTIVNRSTLDEYLLHRTQFMNKEQVSEEDWKRLLDLASLGLEVKRGKAVQFQFTETEYSLFMQKIGGSLFQRYRVQTDYEGSEKMIYTVDEGNKTIILNQPAIIKYTIAGRSIQDIIEIALIGAMAKIKSSFSESPNMFLIHFAEIHELKVKHEVRLRD